MGKRVLSMLLVLTVVFTFAVSGASASADNELLIGTSQPLTGTNAQVADATMKALNLFVEMVNEQGGINGQKLRVISYDDQGSPEEAVKIATKLIEVDKVDWVFASLISSCALATGQFFDEAKLPTIGTGISPTWMGKGWEYVFRCTANTGFSMPLLGQLMKDMGVNSIAMFEGLDDSAKGSADAMREVCKELGIEVLTVETYVDGDTDFSGQVAKIISTNPDAVFSATYNAIQPVFAKQLRQFGYEGIVYNKESIGTDNIAVAGDASNYWIFMFPFITRASLEDIPEDEVMMREFCEMYMAKYNEMPGHECAFRTWDSMLVFQEAARIAGTNEGEAIKEAISQIKGLPILGGVADFSQGDREGLHEFRSFIIIDEKIEDLDKWIAGGGYEALKKGE